MLRRLLLATSLCFVAQTATAQIQSPEEFLGAPVGQDRVLYNWETILGYLQHLDHESGRLHLEELGKTTEGRPFVVAMVSAEAAINSREQLRGAIRALYEVDEADQPEVQLIARDNRAVIAFSLGVHSTEVAASQASMEMLHGLVTREDDITRQIREKLFLLIVPSMNPDGLDLVQEWYTRTVGTESEGTRPLELYHPYAGHDNNRDGFFNNLQETSMWSQMLYHDWLPQMIVDEHQMGNSGPRLFLPPFDDPVSQTVHPLVYSQLSAAGQQTVSDLTAQGWTGIATSTIFTAEWPGSVRSTGFWHNMLGILSEVASARLATPLYFPEGSLGGRGRGLPAYERRANFLEPWPGGWWRLRDIVDIELDLTWALLRWASERKEDLLLNFARMNADAIESGREEAPYAYVIPRQQLDSGSAERCVEILRSGGVEVQYARGSLQFDDHIVPDGAWVVRSAQPFRPFVTEMLGRTEYPRVVEEGRVVRPYDVTAWRLADLLGVEVLEVNDLDALDAMELGEDDPGRLQVTGRELLLPATDLESHVVANAVVEAGGSVGRQTDGSLNVSLDPTRLTEILAGRAVTPSSSPDATATPVRPARIGIFSPWGGSMDEGWTRLVLDRYGFDYERMRPDQPALDGEPHGRKLLEKFDVVLLPSISKATLEAGVQGEGPARVHEAVWPEKYRKGLGAMEAGTALRAFVEAGGTLVAISASVPWAIEYMGLPVRAEFGSSDTDKVYAPGSLLASDIDTSHPLAAGMGESAALYFASGYALRPIAWPEQTRVVARYARRDTVLAGFVEGAEHLAGQPAMVEIPVGEGRVVLFGFHPQRRAQTQGTFKLLLNALWVDAF